MAAPVVSREEWSARRRGQLFIAVAALAWSTAGVLQRELSIGTTTQVAGRAFFAALALAAFVLVASRGRPVSAFRGMGWAGLAVAASIAIASSSFIVSLNHATVASVLFMQAAAPVAAALIAWIALGESVSRRTAVAMGVALAGVAVMVGGPGSPGAVGVAVCVVMTLAFAVSIVVTRHRRDVSMAPAVCLSQVLVLVVFGPLAHPATVSAGDLGFLVLLGVGQMGIGLAFMTFGARLIPAGEVALITLLEVVLGPLWVWIALSEKASTSTIVGGVVVVGAVLLQTTEKQAAPARVAAVSSRAGP